MFQARLFLACVKVAALFSAGLILILSLPAGAVGQGSTPQRGYQPGASYALSDIETINTINGNLMLNLPLGKLAPRARRSFRATKPALRFQVIRQ